MMGRRDLGVFSRGVVLVPGFIRSAIIHDAWIVPHEPAWRDAIWLR
jgi:hypothetical protein